MINDPYAELGVDRNASEKEITQAYRKLAKKYHPDLNPGDKQAAEKMARINEAYERIKNGDTASSGGYGQSTGASEAQMFATIARYINAGYFVQALNILARMPNRNARWYYYSAVANYGVGNTVVAISHAQTAVSMEPGNPEYEELLAKLKNGDPVYEQRRGSYTIPCGGPFSRLMPWLLALYCFCCRC